MRKSECIEELAAALAKAQAVMPMAKMSGHNPHFKSDYSTLADVISAVRKPLADNGLSFAQLPDESNEGIGVETVLMHTSGQWMASITLIPVAVKNAQGVGSALSYARRYGLASMCGLASEAEDDDANMAATGERNPIEKVQEISDLLRVACESEDMAGWWEVWSELSPAQIDYLHRHGTKYLSAKMKNYAKKVEWEMRGKDAVARHAASKVEE